MERKDLRLPGGGGTISEGRRPKKGGSDSSPDKGTRSLNSGEHL